MAAADNPSKGIARVANPVGVALAVTVYSTHAVRRAGRRTRNGNAVGERVPIIALGDIQYHAAVSRGRQEKDRTIYFLVTWITFALAKSVVTDSSPRTFVGAVEQRAIITMVAFVTLARAVIANSVVVVAKTFIGTSLATAQFRPQIRLVGRFLIDSRRRLPAQVTRNTLREDAVVTVVGRYANHLAMDPRPAGVAVAALVSTEAVV